MRIAWLPLLFLLVWSCANQTTPTGGPKDEVPPALLMTAPVNGSTNFKGNQIILVFDEPVRIENAKEQLIISPSVGKDFELIARKNKVTLTLDRPLTDSTTYSIRFRESIKDITEGNPADNVQLAFSTGPQLDSLRIYGKLYDLLAGVPQKDATVAIYSQDTFDIFRHTPDWFARSDNAGRFSIENLRGGKYYLYAFDDKNKNLRIDSRAERYGFHPTPLVLSDSLPPVEIPMLLLDSRPLKLLSNRPQGATTLITLNKSAETASLTTMLGERVPFLFEENRNRILAYPSITQDSLQAHLVVRDSLNNRIDTLLYVKVNPLRAVKEPFKLSLKQTSLLTESGKLTAVLQLSKPVQSFHFDSTFYQLDSATLFHLTPADFTYDTANNLFYLAKTIDPKVFVTPTGKQKSKLPVLSRLYFAKGAFRSVHGDSSIRVIQRISPSDVQDLATLLINIQSASNTYQVQILRGRNRTVAQTQFNAKNMTFRNLETDEYSIRVLVDDNSNGRWDWGDPFLRQPPERVFYYIAPDGKNTVNLRANWEVGPLVLKF